MVSSPGSHAAARARRSVLKTDVDIEVFLKTEGFRGDGAVRARAVLETAGLTRPGKRRLNVAKLDLARVALSSHLLRVCHRQACRQILDPRERIDALPSVCQVCDGSANQRAGELARDAMFWAGYRRLLVIGGTPATHASLIEVLGNAALQLRCIDGTQCARRLSSVDADLAWAHVLVIWATTPLPHKVSQRYISRAPRDLRRITVARRGVEAMCQELRRFAAR